MIREPLTSDRLLLNILGFGLLALGDDAFHILRHVDRWGMFRRAEEKVRAAVVGRRRQRAESLGR